MITMDSHVFTKPFAIFDMDGTLVDSMGCWNDVNLQYLASKGVTINKSVETLMATTAHMTTNESAALLCDMFLPDISAQEVADSLNARMETLYRTQIQEKPGIRAYIEQLKREDVRMCVVSSSPDLLIRACLDRLDLTHFFLFILSSEEVGQGKSDPAVYLYAAKRLGADPSEIAVYEDSLTALKTAKKAGFYTVAVYDQSAAQDWEKARELADAAVSDWRDL